MNKQDKGDGKRGIEWTDFTFNPIAGCFHACAWQMPDGKIANCYAEDVANKFGVTAYKDGFEHHYWRPSALKEPGKVAEPSRIFVGSMADVFGHWVPQDQIEQVLEVCEANPQHSFQFLTKNPKRLKQFKFPANCWVGISAPPTQMWNKPLTYSQQLQWLETSLGALLECNAAIRWMSIEPLSWDIANDLHVGEEFPELQWVVIGAASNGPKIYQPEPEWVHNVVDYMDCYNVPVFFKGNLRGNPAAEVWREEFPFTPSAPLTSVTQGALF